jgi:hypothetical protein
MMGHNKPPEELTFNESMVEAADGVKLLRGSHADIKIGWVKIAAAIPAMDKAFGPHEANRKLRSMYGQMTANDLSACRNSHFMGNLERFASLEDPDFGKLLSPAGVTNKVRTMAKKDIILAHETGEDIPESSQANLFTETERAEIVSEHKAQNDPTVLLMKDLSKVINEAKKAAVEGDKDAVKFMQTIADACKDKLAELDEVRAAKAEEKAEKAAAKAREDELKKATEGMTPIAARKYRKEAEAAAPVVVTAISEEELRKGLK